MPLGHISFNRRRTLPFAADHTSRHRRPRFAPQPREAAAAECHRRSPRCLAGVRVVVAAAVFLTEPAEPVKLPNPRSVFLVFP